MGLGPGSWELGAGYCELLYNQLYCISRYTQLLENRATARGEGLRTRECSASESVVQYSLGNAYSMDCLQLPQETRDVTVGVNITSRSPRLVLISLVGR